MIGLSLKHLAELRREGERSDAIGGVLAGPGPGDIGLARGFVVFLLLGPVVISDGEPAGFFERLGVIGALPIDREP